MPVKPEEVHARVVRTIRPRVAAGLSAPRCREDLYQSNRFGLAMAHVVVDRPEAGGAGAWLVDRFEYDALDPLRLERRLLRVPGESDWSRA